MSSRLRSVALVLAIALSAAAASPVGAPRVPRASLVVIEKNIDKRIERAIPTDQFLVLGATRGIYLEGFGVVFTTEMNLMASAAANPFRPAFTKDDIEQIRRKKIERMSVLREQVRAALIGAGASLDQVPESEQVVLGIVLFYFKWEDTSGLPSQLVMQAPRKALIAAAKGQTAALDGALQVQEF
jgi:hypothetical protein